jgi:hypothetical protein
MRLDHDTGTMSGTVRRGHFQDRHLGELSRDELIELWRECRAEDAQAANRAGARQAGLGLIMQQPARATR